jgi:hypothetical protein
MKSITSRMNLLDNEFDHKKEEVKRLMEDPCFDPFKIADICMSMGVIMRTVLLLEEVREEQKDLALSGFN